jgi:hypothetical protein
LSGMDVVVPWREPEAPIEPFSAKAVISAGG